MCNASGTEFCRLKETTFDTHDVIRAIERVRNNGTAIYIEEVMKCMRMKKRVCNSAEVLAVMREGCARRPRPLGNGECWEQIGAMPKVLAGK